MYVYSLLQCDLNSSTNQIILRLTSFYVNLLTCYMKIVMVMVGLLQWLVGRALIYSIGGQTDVSVAVMMLHDGDFNNLSCCDNGKVEGGGDSNCGGAYTSYVCCIDCGDGFIGSASGIVVLILMMVVVVMVEAVVNLAMVVIVFLF